MRREELGRGTEELGRYCREKGGRVEVGGGGATEVCICICLCSVGQECIMTSLLLLFLHNNDDVIMCSCNCLGKFVSCCLAAEIWV